MTLDERRDAIFLLRTIYGGHEQGVNALDHGWRKCRRCATIHRLDLHDQVLMKLLRLAAEELKKGITE